MGEPTNEGPLVSLPQSLDPHRWHGLKTLMRSKAIWVSRLRGGWVCANCGLIPANEVTLISLPQNLSCIFTQVKTDAEKIDEG